MTGGLNGYILGCHFNEGAIYLPLLRDLRNEDLIIPESMAQYFGFTGVLGKQAHSWLRNWFSSASVKSKDKSDSGIIEFSFLNTRLFVHPFAWGEGL